MKGKPIGIIDSGIGGLTVTKEVVDLLPNEPIIYIGDSKNAPYGSKTSDEIYQRARSLVSLLIKHDVKLIVIACNTITVHCIKKLRQEFPTIPIVGAVPVVKKAAEISKNKRIGILSTSQTAKSSYQTHLIKTFADDCLVFNHGTDALVPLIESGKTDGEHFNQALERVLSQFKKENIDTLALGCTHFPLINTAIQNHLGKNVALLDSGAAIARRVKTILEHNHISNTNSVPNYKAYTTGNESGMTNVLERLNLNQKFTAITMLTL